MYLKKIIAGIVLVGVSMGAQATLIYDALDSIKRGDVTFLKIDGRSLTGEGQITFNAVDDTVKYAAQLSDNWTLDLTLLKSYDFGPYNPRCPGGGSCYTADWFFLGLDGNVENSLTSSTGIKYLITNAWGQFGINAGGSHVAPNDGYASGVWLKSWTEYNVDGSIAHHGTGGDLNVYATQVPEPNALALLGVGIFGMAFARRRAK